MESARAGIVNAQGQVESARSNVEGAKSQVEGAKASLQGAIGQVESARAGLEGARGQLQSAKAAVIAAEGQVAGAKAAVVAAEGEVENSKAAVQSSIGQLESARASVQSAIGQVEASKAAVETAKGQVESAKAAVEAARSGVESAAAGVLAAESGIEGARAAIESANSGVEGATAGIQSAEATVATAEKEIERLDVLAPFAGLLESDTAELGALLQTGGLCGTVIQLDPIKLVGFVPETEVEDVKLGAAAARLATGRNVVGTVTFLSRSADETTRTFRVEVTVPNPDLTIRDGQTAEIVIQADGQEAHLIPQSALTLNDAGDLGVRVVGDGDVTGFKAVEILRDDPDGIYVSGLGAAANIIVVGQEFVSEGVPVAPTYREVSQ
jgi:RND family efflux transporter MFP subunit